MTESTPAFQSEILYLVKSAKAVSEGNVSCVTVCHNEVGIIDQFLAHYRDLGCAQFYIVDDRSDDGTAQYLMEQDDVTLFAPAEGAEFKDNVGKWREQILDLFCSDRWVTLPDVDEFLYYRDRPDTLTDVARKLEKRGEFALLAVMLDMYGYAPLEQQIYTGNGPVSEEFPYFDGPGEPPAGIRIVSQPTSFLKRYPTPQVCFMGGVRERLFYQKQQLNGLQKWLLQRYAHLGRRLSPTMLERWQNQLVRAATKSCFSSTPFVLNKFALLKWQKGTRFSRAPHSIDKKINVSEGLAVLLHYKFYKGVAGLEYSSDRAQHAGGSVHYKKMLDQAAKLKESPVSDISKQFQGLESLAGVVR